MATTITDRLGASPSAPGYGNDLSAIEALNGTGLLARIGSALWALRSVTAPPAGLSVTNGDGVAGNIALALADDLAALEGLASTGFAARTAANTWAQRSLTAPPAGLSITNPAGVAGNPTFALADDLAALEALATTGLARRTGTSTWDTVAYREVLNADRTYYVLTTGSDSNNGLANTSGGAFATLTKALAVAATLDLNGYTLTIQIGAGTFSGYYLIPTLVGQAGIGNFVIKGVGNTTILDGSTGAYAGTVDVLNRALVTLTNLKIQNNSTNGIGLRISAGGSVSLGAGIEFGACALYHINVQTGGTISAGSGMTLSGNATTWYEGSLGSTAYFGGTVAMGTRTFSNATLEMQLGATCQLQPTFTGTVTGKRYNIIMNAACQTFGAGASYIPGSVAGTTATGGQYA